MYGVTNGLCSHRFAHAHLRVFLRARVYNIQWYRVSLACEIMIKRALAVYSLACLVTLLHLQLASASADQLVTWR